MSCKGCASRRQALRSLYLFVCTKLFITPKGK
jgi:hypothetical protein